MSPEYLVTALIVVLAPGTGVIYTLAIALARGRVAALASEIAPMVGASGAVMGLIGVWIVWDAFDMVSAGWPRRRVITAILARCGLLLVLNLVMFVLLHGLLAWQTHLGGFVAGALAALAIRPERAAD